MLKKLLLLCTLMTGITMSASKYKMDQDQLNSAFSKSSEISFSGAAMNELGASLMGDMQMKASNGGKTRGGYLLRSFFCGGIALHRYYMGTSKKHMWALYFCVPVAGGVAACVDFWGAVFSADFYKKFENNDKWFVWLD